MLLVKSMPVDHVRKLLTISHASLTHNLRYWVKKAISEGDLSGVRVICVDETSFKRGHSYVTVISDAKAYRVIDVEERKDADAALGYLCMSEEERKDCNKIKAIISETSPAYINAKNECFP